MSSSIKINIQYSLTSNYLLGGLVESEEFEGVAFQIHYGEEGEISNLLITHNNKLVTEQPEFRWVKDNLELFFEEWWEKNKMRLSL